MSNSKMKNAGAAVTAPDVQKSFEAPQLPEKYNVNWTQRHPIIALHWGMVE